MSPFRVVIADDHAMIRQGIKRVVEEIDDVEVIGEAEDGLALLELLKRLNPDLVILDIFMPNLRGIEAAFEIKTLYPSVKVLILTMNKSKEYLYSAFSAGVEGYLLKHDADIELFSAMQAIRAGKTYISPIMAAELAEDLAQTGNKHGTQGVADPLTRREREIAKLIAEGKSNKEVAELLFISVRTVEMHRHNIMKKLKLKKTAQLIRYAIDKHYIIDT